MSCGVTSAYNDTIHRVYSSNDSDALSQISVTPIHSSMKMVEGTVDTLEAWLAETSEKAIGIESDDNSTVRVMTMTLHMILCPGVTDRYIQDDRIANDVKNFVTENGGSSVEPSSFYHRRVSGMDGSDAIYNWSKNLGSQRVILACAYGT